MCEARVAADAIGLLAYVYRLALRSCAWKQSDGKTSYAAMRSSGRKTMFLNYHIDFDVLPMLD